MGNRRAEGTLAKRKPRATVREGAWLYAETVRQIHAVNPGTGVELLAPDFNADPDQLAEVFGSRPEVFAARSPAQSATSCRFG